jgi:lysyl-tRNA synthetase class 2
MKRSSTAKRFLTGCYLTAVYSNAFVVTPGISGRSVTLSSASSPIISPFDDSNEDNNSHSPVATSEYLELTWENVEKVLDEMRPFLIQDGGNVAITEIDGPVVKLELQVRQLSGNLLERSNTTV